MPCLVETGSTKLAVSHHHYTMFSSSGMVNRSWFIRLTTSYSKLIWFKLDTTMIMSAISPSKTLMRTIGQLESQFRKPSRLASRLFTRIRWNSSWLTLRLISMLDTKQVEHWAAVSSTMERLLAHWYTIFKQPNSGVNLVEFLAERDNGIVLSLDKVQAAPTELEDCQPQVIDPLEEINVGTIKDPQPLFISALLPKPMKTKLCKLLNKFKDCFSWSYDEMLSLDRTFVKHELWIKIGCKPFRQLLLSIKDELVRLLKVGFIRTARYIESLSYQC